MSILSLNIEIYTDRKEPLTTKMALTDLHNIIQQMNTFFERHKTWYLSGNTRQEALQRVAFNQQGATEAAIKEFIEDYTEENQIVISVVWDGEDYNHSCQRYNYAR
ncbi:hypothetical protein [Xenorhabdus eapokensis]|uniref:Phage protein n=1 Tax=Xenorhabdus eapokensis TaxID=1873482 RepID=A0A1Q5TMX2_9GAMM|nr:hypothetical protein [Xenorhabdus eapokensis]OKP01571.1 hypothetical protein Xedl_02845 [Xenorhabdus eapokensis]